MDSVKFQYVIDNVNATMAMEDMPLSDEDNLRIHKCLSGKSSFDQTIKDLIGKYKAIYAV